MTVKETLLSTVKTLAEEAQKIVARQDELLFKIKGLTVTIWAAITGWG